MHDPFPPGLLGLVIVPAAVITLWWCLYQLPRMLAEVFLAERKWKLPRIRGRWVATRPWKFRRARRARRRIRLRRRKNGKQVMERDD